VFHAVCAVRGARPPCDHLQVTPGARCATHPFFPPNAVNASFHWQNGCSTAGLLPAIFQASITFSATIRNFVDEVLVKNLVLDESNTLREDAFKVALT
jgi:hypothetical protein